MDDHDRGYVEELLDRLSMVTWDRFVECGDSVTVYGWIDRDDEYKDYIQIEIWPSDEYVSFTTSSEEHTEEIHELLFGADTVGDHNECQRVENHFDVEQAVTL